MGNNGVVHVTYFVEGQVEKNLVYNISKNNAVKEKNNLFD
jgi:hypothetical protein